MTNTKTLLAHIRTAVADYMRSEGCSCCRDYDQNKINHEKLGKLLNVKPTGTGENKYYDFSKYRSNP